MKFARNGHEGLIVHRNSPQKRAERIEEPSIGTLKFVLHAMIIVLSGFNSPQVP